MKKIIGVFVYILLSVTSVYATVDVEHFDADKDGTIGGIVGDNAIYLYLNEKTVSGMKGQTQTKALGIIAQKQVCENKTVRPLVDAGLSVIYMYTQPNQKGATFIIIKDCK